MMAHYEIDDMFVFIMFAYIVDTLHTLWIHTFHNAQVHTIKSQCFLSVLVHYNCHEQCP